MKLKRNAIAGVALMAMCALVLAGCSSDSAAGDDSTKISMLNSGSMTDSSWTQNWYEGSLQAQEVLGDNYSISYTDQLNSADSLERAGGAALSEGATAVIYGTSEVPQALDRLAKKFPNAFVCGAEGPRKEYLPNVCTMYPHWEEGAFLSGVLAGLTTKTKHVGAIGAFDSPTLTSQMEAFALGVRYVDPTIKVDKVYTMSLSDTAAARAAADAQYAAGADIILVALNDAIRGVFAAAEKHGGLVIGQYVDWYDEAPDAVLGSVLYHLDEVSKRMIELAAAGKLEAKSYEFSLANGPFGELAEFRGSTGELVTDETRAELERLANAIRDGKLVLPGIHEIGMQGASDKVDLKSLKIAG
ncbi:BMP family protein [Cryobacterium sp. BB736]|uniref:BMP family lipoprotein n=1 Tax=Cryobacterium sp. BB736 TaxID=2746963 RepID=UPI0018760794|nr:BMP family ABC transporter substrate-binding protein [Cryobacterium sp. BB736]